MLSRLPFSRALLVAGLLALSLSACGRRGALEPPPDPSAPQQQTQQQAASPAQGTLPSPVGTPRPAPRRGYTIPNQSFVLDPLL